MFPMTIPLTLQQLIWCAIAIGLAAMSAHTVGIAREMLWLFREIEKKKQVPIQPRWSYQRLVITIVLAMMGYVISLIMFVMVFPRY